MCTHGPAVDSSSLQLEEMPPEKLTRYLARGLFPVAVLIARVEIVAASVPLPLKAWAAILETVLPELFEEPTEKPEPTQTLPGTQARLEALARRFERGEQLFTSDDADWTRDDRLEHRPIPLGSGPVNRAKFAGLFRRTHAGGEQIEEAPAASALPRAGQAWGEDELALLGEISDEEVARQTGRALTAIASQRRKVRQNGRR